MQVVSLQAQLASLKEQAAQSLLSNTPNPNEKFYERPSSNPQDVQNFQLENLNMAIQFDHGFDSNLCRKDEIIGQTSVGVNDQNYSVMKEENFSVTFLEGASHLVDEFRDKQTNSRKWAFQDTEDLRSVAFGYIQHS